MAKNGTPTTTRQRRTIAALLGSRTIGEALVKAGVGRSTLSRWLNDKTFCDELAAAESAAIQQAARQLIAGRDEALAALQGLITGAQSEAVKRASARDWLEYMLKMRELAALEERLVNLEKEVYK